MAGTGLRVRRWTKHGHDRLYLSTPAGDQAGWVDLHTGAVRMVIPELRDQLDAAAAAWLAQHGSAVVTDLAALRPGAALEEKAADEQPGNIVIRLGAAVLGVRTRDYSWRTGAAGERAVGALLDTLSGSGWRVLHGIPLGNGGDIDHLVIGPYGTFTVNTKHHPRARVKVGRTVVFVRNRHQPYIGKARNEATKAATALREALGEPVMVAPLVVVHGHRRLKGWVLRRPQGVTVLPSWAVRLWFRLPGRANLTPAQVEALYAVARQPATWRGV